MRAPLGLMAFLSWSMACGDPFETAIPMLESAAATYYVEGHLQGYGDVDLMVDTGSSYTVVNTRVFDALQSNGKAHHLKELSGIMADGSRQRVPIYRLPGLTLGDRCFFENVEVAVFPGDTRNILGIRTLKNAAPFSFSVDPPTLTLSGCAAEAAKDS